MEIMVKNERVPSQTAIFLYKYLFLHVEHIHACHIFGFFSFRQRFHQKYIATYHLVYAFQLKFVFKIQTDDKKRNTQFDFGRCYIGTGEFENEILYLVYAF